MMPRAPPRTGEQHAIAQGRWCILVR
jgi:hypothetical protein